MLFSEVLQYLPKVSFDKTSESKYTHTNTQKKRSESVKRERERETETTMTETTHNNNNNTGPPLLRLAGLKTSQLPAPTATAEDLRPFVTALLREAVPFIDTVAPKAADSHHHHPSGATTPWKPKGVKTLPESDAKVEVTERVVEVAATAGPGAGAGAGGNEGGGGAGAGGAVQKDLWVCRRSVHADSAARGSACWAEFADCLRDRHAETEEAFTPGVVAHRAAVTWAAAADLDLDLDPVEVAGTAWGRFRLALVEMKHRIPAPLRPRVFPVVQLVASAVAPGGDQGQGQGQGQELDEFVVVSVTVDDFAQGGLRDRAVLSADKGVVVGAYASVERVRRLPGPGSGGGGGGGGGAGGEATTTLESNSTLSPSPSASPRTRRGPAP